MTPCGCWYGPPALHDGHCCFTHYDRDTNRVTCGHDEAGMKIANQEGTR